MKRSWLPAFLSCIFALACGHAQDFSRAMNDAVPQAREYAIGHLEDLTEADKLKIVSTAPQQAEANYSDIYYTWAGICTVRANASNLPDEIKDLRMHH